jgi:acyl carrier protein
MSVEHSLKLIFSTVLDYSESKITGDTSPGDVPAWDSIEHINLILAIEKEFDIMLDPTQIQMLDTFGKIQYYIQQEIPS